MGNRAMFALGLAVGYVFGTRAGRERYDQMVEYSKQVAGNPAVQKATQTVKTKTTEVTKTAVAKAPGIAKSATDQVPKIVSTARQMAADHLPSMLGGKNGSPRDDVSDDGQLIYPADDTSTPVNGVRYTT
jgi:hypothetical protein